VTTHVIDPARVHHRWDSSLEPTLRIASGDSVRYDLAMAGRGQVELGTRFEDTAFDWDTLYNLLGPVWIEGAKPGDSLEIEIVSLEPGEWGWTAILPGLGLLPDEFPDPYLRTFDLRDRSRVIEVAPGIGIPFAPFLGTMGTHPGEPDVLGPFPPHRGGGNIDNRHLVAGTSLVLPVWCEGALFSCGDPHAAQGDGEVCVSAVECDMLATLTFRLHERAVRGPIYRVPALPGPPPEGYVGTMGIDPDLMEGARAAVRAMIDWLTAEHGLTREDAYVLCSLAGDLRIHEVVDAGVWNVGFTIGNSVFNSR
jgi:acetamidase/formamidase